MHWDLPELAERLFCAGKTESLRNWLPHHLREGYGRSVGGHNHFVNVDMTAYLRRVNQRFALCLRGHNCQCVNQNADFNHFAEAAKSGIRLSRPLREMDKSLSETSLFLFHIMLF